MLTKRQQHSGKSDKGQRLLPHSWGQRLNTELTCMDSWGKVVKLHFLYKISLEIAVVL